MGAVAPGALQQHCPLSCWATRIRSVLKLQCCSGAAPRRCAALRRTLVRLCCRQRAHGESSHYASATQLSGSTQAAHLPDAAPIAAPPMLPLLLLKFAASCSCLAAARGRRRCRRSTRPSWPPCCQAGAAARNGAPPCIHTSLPEPTLRPAAGMSQNWLTVDGAGVLQITDGAGVHHVPHDEALDGLVLGHHGRRGLAAHPLHMACRSITQGPAQHPANVCGRPAARLQRRGPAGGRHAVHRTAAMLVAPGVPALLAHGCCFETVLRQSRFERGRGRPQGCPNEQPSPPWCPRPRKFSFKSVSPACLCYHLLIDWIAS